MNTGPRCGCVASAAASCTTTPAFEDAARAEELASPYGLWVLSIRTGQGVIPFPTPEEAARHTWTADECELVADRVDTQFVGTPESVAADLADLASDTGADELVVTTITHDHADRVRSHELLAHEWFAPHRQGALA